MIGPPHLSTAEVIYWSCAALCVLAFGLTIFLCLGDTRTINGYESVWTKPLKFHLSLAVHAATLALVSSTFSDGTRNSVILLWVAIVFLAACFIELGYIVLQAARAERSHFNVTTAFHSFMYSVMAAMAVIIVGTAGLLGAVAAFDQGTNLTPTLRIAVAIGLIGGCLLTLVTAFTIGSRMSPYLGAVPGVAPSMRFTGWSLIGGDLRVSHFLATHMMQAIPLAALLAERASSGAPARLITLAIAAAWIGWTLFEYRHALNGAASPIARSIGA